MYSSTTSMIRKAGPLRAGLALVATAIGMVLQSPVAQAAMPATGIACTESAGPNPTFTLTATDGYIQLPDGNTMYMWSYAGSSGAFQYPGPVLCVNEGDTVTVVLKNVLDENVSIMFPGQENVLANGVQAQPEELGALLTSLTTSAPKINGVVTYSFVASKPGTYIYESGTFPQKQVRMGLFGALIVRPAQGAGYMYDRPGSRFTTGAQFASEGTNTYIANEEYMVLLSEIDPFQHQAAEQGASFDFDNYIPRYWLINGRGFPDSIANNGTVFLPDQPYGALARIHPYDPATHPFPGAIRYLNVGTEEFPFHPHGQNGSVIGRDGAPLANAAGEDLSFEKFAINIGPGQTWDVLFQWQDAEKYNSRDNPVPVVIPQVNNQEFGMFYSGSPYLGETGPLPPGASTLNTCGEFYIISHNHALYQITSWGVNLTGPITYLRVDPTNCVPTTR